MIAAVLLITVAALAPAPACPAAQMAPSLNQAVGQTLTSVRSGNGNALLAQMSHEGVAFGAQGGIVSHVSLADQFGHRRGHYCDLFVCQGRAGRFNALFNSGSMEKSLDVRHARADVVLNGRTPRELDLGYAYTAQCKWELASIGAL